MSAAKGAKLAARALFGAPRKHYCPICPESEKGDLEPMIPVMVMPKKNMIYVCRNGYEANRGETILV